MSSVERALLVLEEVVGSSRPVSHGGLARSLDVPKSTLSQLLLALRRAGYVGFDGSGYLPGVRLLALGQRIFHSSSQLRTPHKPVLDRLASQMGETAMLSSAVGDNVVFLDQSPSPHPIRYMAEIGDVRPLHATAAGRVFLAFGNRSVRSLGTLVAVTGDTTTDPVALSAELDRVRQMGYATNRGEGVTGVYGIAAPIFHGQAVPVAALGVAGPADRMEDMETRVWPGLAAAIDEIERSHRMVDARSEEGST